MTSEQLIIDYLTEQPLARERKNRSRALWRLLERKYGVIESITIDKWLDYYPEAESLNRMIRKVQAEKPELQGIDYDGDNGGKTKAELEFEVQKKLGYQAGHFPDVKLLEQHFGFNE